MKRFALLPGLALCLSAAQARAHAFEHSVDPWAEFQEGFIAILAYPQSLLPLLALGLLLGLWRTFGILQVWPLFLAGQVLGILAGPHIGLWAYNVVLVAGIVVAGLAAMLPSHSQAEARILSFLIGLGALGESLAGHLLFAPPIYIYLGVLLTVNGVVAGCCVFVGLTLKWVPARWMNILWRVAASWLAAIMMIVLAFSLRVG